MAAFWHYAEGLVESRQKAPLEDFISDCPCWSSGTSNAAVECALQKGWPPNLKEATAAREHGGKHDPKSFAQELVLTPQTPFDLGHQIYGEAQVLRGLLQGLDGLLCLVVISEALLRCEAATLSDFRVFFTSRGGGHVYS